VTPLTPETRQPFSPMTDNPENQPAPAAVSTNDVHHHPSTKQPGNLPPGAKVAENPPADAEAARAANDAYWAKLASFGIKRKVLAGPMIFLSARRPDR
jgi:hypothetical protein